MPGNMTDRKLLMALLVLGACGGSAGGERLPDPVPVPDSVVWNGDPELAPVLRRGNLGALEMQAAERVEAYVGANEFTQRLGVIAEDTTAPWVVRVNALSLLADRGATAELPAFTAALRAPEERVRVAAVSGLRRYLLINPQTSVELLAIALRDPNPRVQARALEIISDRDVEVLRNYYATTRNAELRGVALDLIRTAEGRGAPLVAKDTAGNLERTTTNGAIISFRPTQRWPHWDSAVGELRVRSADSKQSVLVAANVEVVGGVVPAFMATDSADLVYEANREIRVRSLRTNADRKIADGIAPRILPFTNDVIFFREIRARRSETPNSTGYKYEVVRMPIAGGEPRVVGQIGATAQNNVKGHYSPVRWAHVREQEGRFYLVGETIEEFELPNPFGN